MPFFDGARGRLHHRRWPVANPLAVTVLLPGLGQHSSHYHRFARTVAAAAIETFALDTSGHGLSEGDQQHPGSLPELVADACQFIELVRTTHATAPLIVLGHSLGAVTALGSLGAAVPDTWASADPAAVAAQYPPVPALSTPLAGLILSGTPKRALGGGTPEAPGAALSPTLPVLALHGTEDRRAPIDAIRTWTTRHPWVTLHEYPDAGHDLLHEPIHPRVTADITAWIRKITTAPARRP